MDAASQEIADQLSSMASSLNAAIARGDAQTATALQAAIGAGQAQLQATNAAPASGGSFFSKVPWWGWLLAAGALYYATKGRKKR